MNRIRGAERLLVEPFGPAVGIIVDPDRIAARADVNMMCEGEMAKAKRLLSEGGGQTIEAMTKDAFQHWLTDAKKKFARRDDDTGAVRVAAVPRPADSARSMPGN